MSYTETEEVRRSPTPADPAGDPAMASDPSPSGIDPAGRSSSDRAPRWARLAKEALGWLLDRPVVAALLVAVAMAYAVRRAVDGYLAPLLLVGACAAVYEIARRAQVRRQQRRESELAAAVANLVEGSHVGLPTDDGLSRALERATLAIESRLGREIERWAAEAQATAEALDDERARSTIVQNEHEKSVADLEGQLREQRESLDAARDELDAWQSRSREELEAERRRHAEELERLESERAELERSAAEARAARGEIERTLETERDGWRRQREELERADAARGEEISRLRAEVEETTERCRSRIAEVEQRSEREVAEAEGRWRQERQQAEEALTARAAEDRARIESRHEEEVRALRKEHEDAEFRRGEETRALRQAAESLEERLRDAEARATALAEKYEAEVRSRDAECARLDESRTAFEERERELASERDAARAAVAELERRVGESETRIRELTRQLEEQSSLAQDTEGRLASGEAEAQQLRELLDAERESAGELRERLDAAAAEREQLEASLAQTTRELEEERATHQASRAEAEARRSEIERRSAELQNNLSSLQSEFRESAQEFRDLVGDKERLVAAVRDAETTQLRFFDNVSGKLRGPLHMAGKLANDLTLTRQEAEAVADPSSVLEDVVEKSQRICAYLRRLDRLVDQVVDLSRLESGRWKTVLCDVGIGQLVRSVVAEFEGTVREKRIEVETEIPVDLPDVVADQRLVSRTFREIFSNAVHFVDEGGEIRVAATVEPGDGKETALARLVVEDNGPGVAPKDRERIFRAFEQAGNRPRFRTLESGSGLGLTLVRRYLELQGGSARVEGEVGQGTRLVVEIPVRRVATE